MTSQEEFLLSLVWMSVNTLFAILAWLKSEKARLQSEETHHVVNSRVDEFKQMVLKASEASLAEFKRELQRVALMDAADERGKTRRR